MVDERLGGRTVWQSNAHGGTHCRGYCRRKLGAHIFLVIDVVTLLNLKGKGNKTLVKL